MVFWMPDELDMLKSIQTSKTTSPLQIYQEMVRLGLTRHSYSAVRAQLSRLIVEGKLRPKNDKVFTAKGQGRVGYFDIECTSLVADFGYMLSWAIKERGKNRVISDRITGQEIQQLKLDGRLVKSFIQAASGFDVLIGYNSDRFDWPFLRTRALYHKIRFPGFDQARTLDAYWIARSKLRLRSKRLEVVAQHLGIPGKTRLEPETWIRAALGNKRAIDYVLAHNIADCAVLERVHARLETFTKGSLKSI